MAEKIRFKDNKLQYSNGEIVDIPFSVLLSECKEYFQNEYDGLKITCVLSEVLKKLTGCEFSIYKCRDNEMFRKLEKEIISTECYQERKEQITKKSQERHSARRGYEAEIRNSQPDWSRIEKEIARNELYRLRCKRYGNHGSDK